MEYKIPIVQTRIKKKQMTSMHLIAGFMTALLGAIILALPEELKLWNKHVINTISSSYIIIGFLIVIVTISINKRLQNKSTNNIFRSIESTLFLVISILCLIQKWWAPLAYAVVGLGVVMVTWYLELIAHKPEYITINEKEINIKRMTSKEIDWAEVKNFLVRHGNVTINLKNNTLYQFAIHNPKELNNKETLEQFAQHQIESNAHKYQQDW